MATTNWQKIQIICPKCDGNKTVAERSNPAPEFDAVNQCDLCKGKGYISWGRLKVDQEAE